jgi:hypothetical protein
MAPQEQDASTMMYRLASLEQQIKQLQEQLKLYVPAGEHTLQLQNIQTTVARIERDVIEIKAKQGETEKEVRERDEKQREAQSALQIRFLISVVSFVVLIVGGVVTGYITHFFR